MRHFPRPIEPQTRDAVLWERYWEAHREYLEALAETIRDLLRVTDIDVMDAHNEFWAHHDDIHESMRASCWPAMAGEMGGIE
jgi:hypothetical protein